MSASVHFLKKGLTAVEILAGYIFYTILLQFTFTVFSLNLHLFEMPEDEMVLWTVKLMGFTYYPILNLWLFSVLFSKQHSALIKAVSIFLFLALLAGMDWLHGVLGYIDVIAWSMLEGMLRHLALTAATLLFMICFRRLKRREQKQA